MVPIRRNLVVRISSSEVEKKVSLENLVKMFKKVGNFSKMPTGGNRFANFYFITIKLLL